MLNGNNPSNFEAQMRVDGSPGNNLRFANVGVNNTIPPCCSQEINSLIIPQITNSWVNFTIEVHGTQVRYFIAGTPVTDNSGQVIVQTLNNPVCSIIPKVYFKGMGLIDNLTITNDISGAIIYNETFDGGPFAQVPSCSDISTSFNFTGPDCNNNSLQLFANPDLGQTYGYTWSGPNGFTSNSQNPVIPNATAANAGVYTVTASYNSCNTATYTLNVNFDVPICTECSDTCYWKVTGNHILSNRNIFGTLTNHDIRIFSNNTPRGIIQAGGYFGWKTTSPSTTFHVYADRPTIARNGPPSGVRFENLPSGPGDVLVIDANGYVFRQGFPEIEFPFRSRIDSLEKEIAALKSLISSYKNGGLEKRQTQNSLSQNKPNPFSDITNIDCYVAEMRSNAFLAVYDLTGKELMKYRLNGKGSNTVQVNSKNLADGMYIYSLIIDGEEVASKKMVISRN